MAILSSREWTQSNGSLGFLRLPDLCMTHANPGKPAPSNPPRIEGVLEKLLPLG